MGVWVWRAAQGSSLYLPSLVALAISSPLGFWPHPSPEVQASCFRHLAVSAETPGFHAVTFRGVGGCEFLGRVQFCLMWVPVPKPVHLWLHN